jgi:hypothetical protein
MWINRPVPPTPLPSGWPSPAPSRIVGFNPRYGTCFPTPCGTPSGFVSRAGHRTQGRPLRGQPWAGEFKSFRLVPAPGLLCLWSRRITWLPAQRDVTLQPTSTNPFRKVRIVATLARACETVGNRRHTHGLATVATGGWSIAVDCFPWRVGVGILVVPAGGTVSGLLGALPPDPRHFRGICSDVPKIGRILDWSAELS